MAESEPFDADSLWLGKSRWCSARRWEQIGEAAVLLEWGSLRASAGVSGWRGLAMDWPALCFSPMLALLAYELAAWWLGHIVGDGAFSRGMGMACALLVFSLALTRAAEAHALARRHCEWLLAHARMSWLGYASENGADAEALRNELVGLQARARCIPGAMAACVASGRDDLRDESSFRLALVLAKWGGGWREASKRLSRGYPSKELQDRWDRAYFQAELARRESGELNRALPMPEMKSGADKLRLFASRGYFM